MATILTENLYRDGHYVVSQANGYRSREQAIIVSGSGKPRAGTVLGKIATGAASTAYAGTGNGVITMDATTPVLAGAKPGAYTATVIAAATNSGTFRVEDPDGNVIGDVAVGGTFADDIKFVIADGATDFVVGDKFTITVASGSGKYAPLNLVANNGSQIAAAILWNASVDATSADARATITARSEEVNAAVLAWPVGITDPQRNAALAQLAALGIIAR